MKQTFCSFGLDISRSCCSNTGCVRISSTIRTYPLDMASNNASPTLFISSTCMRSSTICNKFYVSPLGFHKYIFSNKLCVFLFGLHNFFLIMYYVSLWSISIQICIFCVVNTIFLLKDCLFNKLEARLYITSNKFV